MHSLVPNLLQLQAPKSLGPDVVERVKVKPPRLTTSSFHTASQSQNMPMEAFLVAKSHLLFGGSRGGCDGDSRVLAVRAWVGVGGEAGGRGRGTASGPYRGEFVQCKSREVVLQWISVVYCHIRKATECQAFSCHLFKRAKFKWLHGGCGLVSGGTDTAILLTAD